jgi:GTP diphosphokinase / guanosine-3',5'-bis(diphosphate) 3'-diphosphatase
VRYFEMIDQVLSYHAGADVALLEKAYVFSARIHGGKERMSSEPYLDHPLAVAGILAQMKLDEETIAAGLLHDVMEEQCATAEELEEHFGPQVTHIVQGVTKLSQLAFSNRQERQAEYIRKMVLAMSADVRVVLVKLADRLHEIRRLQDQSEAPPKILAQETRDIYAPLAGRLGIDWIKQELEDLAFRCLEPEAWEKIRQGLAKTEAERRRYIDELKEILTSKMEQNGIRGRISGRPKHLYSIHLKMLRQDMDLHGIYDLIAFRIVVDSVTACYETLAMVHAAWEPVAGRYKDYIAKPKSNMYQSLHTTVVGPHREHVEIQIRTEDMNKIANEGIAAHWLYKEGARKAPADKEETQRFSWLREVLEWDKEWRDPKGLTEVAKIDFYPDEVYVFTPMGDVKVLPRGSSPLDFAYEVHTEVGHRCVGAKVNGKLVPLRHELENGDTIEVLTAASQRPSKDWLKFVKTTKAINRIRHWMKAEERERSISLGRELCERDFRKKGLSFNNLVNSSELLEVARALSLRTVDDLLASIGFRKVTPNQVLGRLSSLTAEEEVPREETILVEKRKSAPPDEGIKVRGVDDVMIRMAKCCNPVPGEEIVGYITRGRGITVHRLLCRNLDKGDVERRIEVQWDSGKEQTYPVDISVVYSGDKGMLATLSSVLGQSDTRVVAISLDARANDMNVCRLTIEVKDTGHLSRVLAALRGEKGVYQVRRYME